MQAVIVIHVHDEGNSKLTKVVDAGNAASGLFCATQSREHHPRENGDDGDDDQKFDEGEGAEKPRAGGVAAEVRSFFVHGTMEF